MSGWYVCGGLWGQVSLFVLLLTIVDYFRGYEDQKLFKKFEFSNLYDYPIGGGIRQVFSGYG